MPRHPNEIAKDFLDGLESIVDIVCERIDERLEEEAHKIVTEQRISMNVALIVADVMGYQYHDGNLGSEFRTKFPICKNLIYDRYAKVGWTVIQPSENNEFLDFTPYARFNYNDISNLRATKTVKPVKEVSRTDLMDLDQEDHNDTTRD